MTTLSGAVAPDRLRLDWRAYFRNFVETHGEPIRADGRLLFRDGWGYSATSHAGPEFPPPSDPEQLQSLQRLYWTRQLAKLKDEQTGLANRIRGLAEWNARMSMPLQQRRIYEQEEGRGVIRKVGEPEDLDLSGLNSNLADVTWLIEEAREELEKLNEH
jgi:hypothetical protein